MPRTKRSAVHKGRRTAPADQQVERALWALDGIVTTMRSLDDGELAAIDTERQLDFTDRLAAAIEGLNRILLRLGRAPSWLALQLESIGVPANLEGMVLAHNHEAHGDHRPLPLEHRIIAVHPEADEATHVRVIGTAIREGLAQGAAAQEKHAVMQTARAEGGRAAGKAALDDSWAPVWRDRVEARPAGMSKEQVYRNIEAEHDKKPGTVKRALIRLKQRKGS